MILGAINRAIDWLMAHDTRMQRDLLYELTQSGWRAGPRFQFCRETAALAVAGVCPVHGGNECLCEYVQATWLMWEGHEIRWPR